MLELGAAPTSPHPCFLPEVSPKRPLPHPTTLAIDRQGRVRWRFTEVDYKVRPSNEDVLKEVAKVESAKPKGETRPPQR